MLLPRRHRTLFLSKRVDMSLQSSALDRLCLGAETVATDAHRMLDVTEALSLFIAATYLEASLSSQNLLRFKTLTGTLRQQQAFIEAVSSIMLVPSDKAQRELSLSLWYSLRTATVFNSGRRLYTHRSNRLTGNVEIRVMRSGTRNIKASLPLRDAFASCLGRESVPNHGHQIAQPSGPIDASV